MKKKKLRYVVFALVIITLLVMYAGCGGTDDSTADNLNDLELLNIGDVVELLNDNGMGLTKATDFPVDLSLSKVHDKVPQVYLNSQTRIYYLFYEYDGYNETSILVDEDIFDYYTYKDKDNSNFMLPGSGITGKNLFIGLWYSELSPWSDPMTEEDIEIYIPIMEERDNLVEILYKKAFNEKTVILTGHSDNWEVKMPINYFYNKRENENGITETVFKSNGKTLLKYINSEEELPDVTSMSWSISEKRISTGSTTTVDEGSVLKEEVGDGFYIASRSDPQNYNPEIEMSLIVKITWNGQTEEISISQ